MNDMTQIDPLERRLHEIEALLDTAATTRAEAEAATERMKQTLSVMVVHHKGKGLGTGEAEHQARASTEYKGASDAWIMANYAYRSADAKAEAARLKIDVWRTRQSTERAKMQLR
jgi:hypothetical protein